MSLLKERVANYERQLSDLECDHQVIKIRYREAVNGGKMYKRQCVRCGDLVGNWIPHDTIKLKETVEPVNDTLAATYRKTKFELTKALKDLIIESKSDGRKKEFDNWYQQYLSSPEWQAKRNLVFERCNYICEGCRLKRATVAHHLVYKNVGKEFIFELVGLCHECHDRYHDKNGQLS